MEGQLQGRWAEGRAAAELQELVARLERSGLAERRADVRQLLESSRLLLHAAAPMAGPRPRAEPSARKLAGKLAALLVLGLDALVLLAFAWGVWSMLTRSGSAWTIPTRPEAGATMLGPAWILLRLPWAREGLREAGCWLLYYLAWGYDWFAEAFSRRAMHRLSARLAAREVMWAWRRHGRSLLHRPGPRDVEDFLGLAYGVRAAESFRLAAGMLGQGDWSLRGGPPVRNRAIERLEALRWSVLIRLFTGLAASGALWPAPEPAPRSEPIPEPAPPPALAEAPAPVLQPEPALAEPPEITQRRVDLRDLIRRKRQDITTAYGWKLKTEAEIAQRDTYLRQTRKEIAALERELVTLGG